jgi:hypothetical protein
LNDGDHLDGVGRQDKVQFSKAGLELAACGNTMKSQNVTLGDLLPGFTSADKGGVGPNRGTAVAGIPVPAPLSPAPYCCYKIAPRCVPNPGIDML